MYLSVYLLRLVKYQSLSLPWAFTISTPPVKKQIYMNDLI